MITCFIVFIYEIIETMLDLDIFKPISIQFTYHLISHLLYTISFIIYTL